MKRLIVFLWLFLGQPILSPIWRFARILGRGARAVWRWLYNYWYSGNRSQGGDSLEGSGWMVWAMICFIYLLPLSIGLKGWMRIWEWMHVFVGVISIIPIVKFVWFLLARTKEAIKTDWQKAVESTPVIDASQLPDVEILGRAVFDPSLDSLPRLPRTEPIDPVEIQRRN